MPFALTGVDSWSVQTWLGAQYPKLADACDRIPGLANTVADIVEAIEAHVVENRVDPATLTPSAIIVGQEVRISL